MKRNYLLAALAVGVIASFASVPAWAENPYQLAWVRQLGTSMTDTSWSVALDGSGNAYICGYTLGSLGGPNAGGSLDVFLAKYDASGGLTWIRQMGSNDGDYGYSVAVDTLGNAYITGHTWGSLGGPNAGREDAFLAKYDASGNILWTSQLGTSDAECCYSVAVDGSGNAYITGLTSGSLGAPNAGGNDAFLAKFDTSGGFLWTRQLGTSGWDSARSVALDGSGNAYIVGMTEGSLGGDANAGGNDAFLAKYDSSGSLLWTHLLGTSTWDIGCSVATDNLGNAYICGSTSGSLGGPNVGGNNVFLAKYDASGSLLWIRQFGTGSEYGYSIAVDGAGNAYVSGVTWGSLGGPNAGWADAFLAKYDTSGNPLWICQLGAMYDDLAYGVAVDGAGRNVYITGRADGSLGGPNAGAADAFLAKYVVPEPATITLLALGALGLLAKARRARK